MRICVATLRSASGYSPSRFHGTAKLDGELDDAYERRTWREHAHYNAKGEIFIPPMSFKFGFSAAAKFVGEKIPGKGGKTWTARFKSGIICSEPVMLGVKKEDMDHVWIFAHANGKRGSGTRVQRCFPMINEWTGKLAVHVLDDLITPEAFRKHLEEAGKYIGVGRFRPENEGFNGRWKVEDCEWSENE